MKVKLIFGGIMTRRKYIILFFGFVLIIMLVIIVFYPPWDYYRGRPGALGPGNEVEFLEMMRRRLDLNDEQFVSISVLYKQDEALREKYREQIAEKLSILDELLMAEKFDEQRVRRTLEEVDVLKREERILLMKKKYQMEKFLSPEQKRVMNEHLREKMRRLRTRFNPEEQKPPEND